MVTLYELTVLKPCQQYLATMLPQRQSKMEFEKPASQSSPSHI